MENNFFDSYHCTSRFHCAACRDIENEDFRRQLYQNFSDVREVDFDCPHGVPWGAKGEMVEVPKEQFDDRHLLNIDLVKSNWELFQNIEGLQGIVDEYNKRVEKAQCTPCLRARVNRALSRKVVASIRKNNNTEILNALNPDLLLADGETDKRVSEWKSEIKNAL